MNEIRSSHGSPSSVPFLPSLQARLPRNATPYQQRNGHLSSNGILSDDDDDDDEPYLKRASRTRPRDNNNAQSVSDGAHKDVFLISESYQSNLRAMWLAIFVVTVTVQSNSILGSSTCFFRPSTFLSCDHIMMKNVATSLILRDKSLP